LKKRSKKRLLNGGCGNAGVNAARTKFVCGPAARFFLFTKRRAFVLLLKVARDFGRVQEFVDFGGFFERLVRQEFQVGGDAQA